MEVHAESSTTSPLDPPAVSLSMLQGAKDFKIENSILTNVQGDLTIFKFGDGGPLSAEFKSLLVNHLAGYVTVQDLDKMKKRILIQAIRNLPRADAAYNDYSPQKEHVSCFKGTRRAILQNIAEAIGSLDDPKIYLLSGLAGIGKSTIARTVAERADNLRCLAASFFFSRDEVDRRSAKKFFSTIAYQLCVHNKEFSEAIGDVLLTERGSAATTKGPPEQLEVLILGPLRDLAGLHSWPRVIVIDALDECDIEDGVIVLTALNKLVQELPSFKVVLTTRPHPHLQHLLDSLGSHRIFHLQNIEDNIINNDMRLYLRHHLSWEEVRSRLPGLRAKWTASHEEIEHLIQFADKIFIIASIAVRFILDVAAYNPRSQMQILKDNSRVTLNRMENVYFMILRRAIPSNCASHIKERFKIVIGTIIFAQEPLTVGTLEHFTHPWAADDIDAILKNLQPVILLNDDAPRIYHKSLSDILTDTGHCAEKDFLIDPIEQHTRIAIGCFRILNARLKQNIMGLGNPARFMENGAGLAADGVPENHLREKIPGEFRYACIYWKNHVEGASIGDADLLEELQTFGNEHLLHWFEALSWINELDSAHRALHVLLKRLKSTSSDMSHEVFADGLRFISKYYAIIYRSALHTYHSALAFTPMKILLYHRHETNMIHNLCRIENGLEHWDALIATLDNGMCVIFSSDSSQLVSWSRKDMKLWDATSGTPVRTFDGDRIAIAEDFSKVASGLETTVTLLNVSTNMPVATLQHPSEVMLLDLSSDGTRLAAGLLDGTVSLWDAEKGTFMKSLGGFARESAQLAFLSNSYRLAFMSSGGDIQLWNGADGEFIATLNHESQKHIKFVFPHGSSRLASITQDGDVNTLRLWNSDNGEYMGVARHVGDLLSISDDGFLLATGGRGKVQLWSGSSLALVDILDIGEEANVYSLAFSHDILAIGSDFSIALHDLRNRVVVATLKFYLPSSLVFSRDSTRLAAGNWNGAVRLWDVSIIKASMFASNEQSSSVTALAFSMDCSRLAGGFKDGTVKLWNVNSVGLAASATHKLHSKRVSTLAFSPDGKQFVSGSEDETVMLWDGRSGSPSGPLRHAFSDELISVAFSTRLIAAATHYNITLWGRKTLRLWHAYDQRSDMPSFSPDGSLLASTYNHRTLQACAANLVVWDVEKSIPVAKFNVDATVRGLTFSPDCSQLAARLNDGDFRSFSVINKIIEDAGCEDPFEASNWNGILVSPGYDRSESTDLCCVLGRFPGHRGAVPILHIPRDVRAESFAVGSSVFALGLADGRVLVACPSTSHTS